MSDAEVWLTIARLILEKEYCGPYICNLANHLRREGHITDRQHTAVMRAVNRERERQGGGDVLWKDIYADEDRGRMLRIQFCTEQIRKLGRKAR